MSRVSATERAATRGRLIEAGKREFAERGLAGARFDEISLAAGHAKGTIYNYFASKEELFFTIVEDWCALVAATISGIGERGAGEVLVDIARNDVEIARKDPDLAMVVVQQVPALAVSHAERVEAALAPAIELLGSVLASGLDRGELVSSHPARALARLFLGVLSAVEIEALLPGGDIDLDDVPGLIDDLFVKGLRPS